jgi:predicted flap endonuclease-1-like 5' DNA nuclease
LSEKGNELLGNWRSATRYEPSEIARELNLAQEEDLKLRRVNLKYLSHLQRLSDEDVVQMARQSELNEGLLFSLRDEARARQIHDVPLIAQYLHERIGTEVWAKLQQEGIKSVWDLAVRTPAEIQPIAQKHNIDPGILTKYSDAAKALALAQHLQGRIGTELWAKLQQEGIKSVWDLAARTPVEIQPIAQKHNIDPGILTKHSDDAKALAKTLLF